MSFHVPERYRFGQGRMKSTALDGNNGYFFIPPKPGEPGFQIIASDGEGWEHVSVKVVNGAGDTGIPLWEEMCFIKGLFWDDHDVVMQLHPAKVEYVNTHPHVLHLWRPTQGAIPTPPKDLVG